jgi:hypothetical protein
VNPNETAGAALKSGTNFAATAGHVAAHADVRLYVGSQTKAA